MSFRYFWTCHFDKFESKRSFKLSKLHLPKEISYDMYKGFLTLVSVNSLHQMTGLSVYVEKLIQTSAKHTHAHTYTRAHTHISTYAHAHTHTYIINQFMTYYLYNGIVISSHKSGTSFQVRLFLVFFKIYKSLCYCRKHFNIELINMTIFMSTCD